MTNPLKCSFIYSFTHSFTRVFNKHLLSIEYVLGTHENIGCWENFMEKIDFGRKIKKPD